MAAVPDARARRSPLPRDINRLSQGVQRLAYFALSLAPAQAYMAAR